MIYEVVRGQVLLAKRKRFQELHSGELVSAYQKFDISVICCLIADIGNIGEFCDVFCYPDFQMYDEKTTRLEAWLYETGYYGRIQECISGSINVQIMSDLRLNTSFVR